MNGVLSKALVERSFAFVRPAIEAVFETGVTGRRHLAIVVTAVDTITGWQKGSSVPFADSCYLVTSLGDLSVSSWPNMEIALSKAEISARTGMATDRLAPAFLQCGDTIFHGSVVLEGVVAACAGLDPRYDAMFAWWLASAVQAQAALEFAEAIRTRPEASFWRSR